MNRVDPLREGSGECIALIEFDRTSPGEFRRRSKKISFQIISLLNNLYHSRHRHWPDRGSKLPAGPGGMSTGRSAPAARASHANSDEFPRRADRDSSWRSAAVRMAQGSSRIASSETMLAPLVLRMLKFSYSSRAPMLPKCTWPPKPQANWVPLSESEKKLPGLLLPPLEFQRATPSLANTSTNGTGSGMKP